MANFHTATRIDPARTANKNLHDWTDRFFEKDNAEFLAEVARSLKDQTEPKAAAKGPKQYVIDAGGVAAIGLIGEYGLTGQTLRRAQEFIRADRSPCYWSHAFLISTPLSAHPAVNRNPRKSAWIWESSLEPAAQFTAFMERNGVSARRISDYAEGGFDACEGHSVPNIGIIAFGLTKEEREAILARADDPHVDQLHYDLLGLLGNWYGYITDTATKPNPLASGQALFSSAYLQLAYDAAGIDLALGAHQRNVAPEHIWQASKWLYAEYRVSGPKQEWVQRPVVGWYCIRDKYGLAAPFKEAEEHLPLRLSERIRCLEKRPRKTNK